MEYYVKDCIRCVCSGLGRECGNRRRRVVDGERKSLRRSGGLESRIADALVDGEKDFDGLRPGGTGRSRHGDRIHPRQCASGLGGRTAGRSATRLQQHRARYDTQDYSCQPAAALAAYADTQAGEAETRDRQPRRIERTATEKRSGRHRTGHGRDGQRGASRLSPGQRDGGGSICGRSRCDH